MAAFARIALLLLGLFFATSAPQASRADDFILADGAAWPGRIVQTHGVDQRFTHVRPLRLADEAVPRVQSLTMLPGGRVIFCSGLDRAIYEQSPRGEQRFRHGGYLARQVRAGADGKLYWSGLETPLDSNPLPDGFISACDPVKGEVTQSWTFSQGDVGRDWWGAFDVFEGRLYVGTSRDRTSIYDVTTSPVQRITTLPIAATAFRFGPDGKLHACDGRGKLYRYADLTDTSRGELVFETASPFVDFDWVPSS